MNTLNRRALAVAILAAFVAFLDGTVINVALPAITDELGGGLPVQQWVVDAYLITLGALILLAGSLSDLFGRVAILRIGLIGFGVTSIACGLAPTAELLIVARAAQGVAGAAVVQGQPLQGAGDQGAGMADGRRAQLFLAAGKVVVERPLGGTGLFQNVVDAGGRIGGSLPLGESGVFDVALPSPSDQFSLIRIRRFNFGLIIVIMVVMALVARKSKKQRFD